MEYKVIPFVASVDHKAGNPSVAKQLQEKIDKYTAEGWTYLRLEAVTTFGQPNGGCFGRVILIRKHACPSGQLSLK